MVYTNYTFMVMTGDGLWHCFTHMNYETLQIMEWDKPSTNWCRIYSIHSSYGKMAHFFWFGDLLVQKNDDFP
jgi:starvation-inducible outer membrane lipoprotein